MSMLPSRISLLRRRGAARGVSGRTGAFTLRVDDWLFHLPPPPMPRLSEFSR